MNSGQKHPPCDQAPPRVNAVLLPGGVEDGKFVEIRPVKAPVAGEQAVCLVLRMGTDQEFREPFDCAYRRAGGRRHSTFLLRPLIPALFVKSVNPAVALRHE